MAAPPANSDLPPPCADCRALVDRVAAGVGPEQWEQVAAAHPHARPDDPRAGNYLRCSACGCCWAVEWHWETGAAVWAERLSEPEYRRRLRRMWHGPPFWETRGAAALVNAALLLAVVVMAMFVGWANARAEAPWWAGAPWFLLGAVLAFVTGRELSRLARGG